MQMKGLTRCHTYAPVPESKKAATMQRLGEARMPIQRSIITKKAKQNFRLRSTPEILGISIQADDTYEEKTFKGKELIYNDRDHLKDLCWKQLLVSRPSAERTRPWRPSKHYMTCSPKNSPFRIDLCQRCRHVGNI